MTQTITFNVESADRSVGIMSEGFSAWSNSETWCFLNDIGEGTFTWYDAAGDECPRPKNAAMVETTLLAYANAYYERAS